MRFDSGVMLEEYQDSLRVEVAATFGEQRALEDQEQIDAAAKALRRIAELALAPTGEDPFFLGNHGDV